MKKSERQEKMIDKSAVFYPITAYAKNMAKAFIAMKKNYKKAKTDRVRAGICKRFVLKYLSLFEQYFKDITSLIYSINEIDETLFPASPDGPKSNILYDELSFLVWLELAQDLRSIDKVMSQIFWEKKSFFEEVSRFPLKISDPEEKNTFENRWIIELSSSTFILKKFFPQWKKNINELFRMRTQYLKYPKKLINLDLERFVNLLKEADALLFSSNNYIYEQLRARLVAKIK